MSESQEQPSLSKPEAQPLKSVIEEGKADVQESVKKSSKAISKKQLVQRLVASAIVAANIGIPADYAVRGSSVEEPRGVTRELSLQDLEKRVENLYQVQIISPEELPEIDIDNEKFKTLEWNREDMGRLMKDLDKLPPHFYFPAPSEYILHLGRPFPKPEDWPDDIWEQIKQEEYEGALSHLKEKLGGDFTASREEYEKAKEQGYFSHTLGFYPAEFILVDAKESQDDIGWIGKCLCLENSGEPNTQSKIPLDYRLFKAKDQSQEFITVAHESIHRITTPDDQKFVTDLFGISVFEQEKMKELLGTNVDKVRERFGIHVGNNLNNASKNALEFLAEGGEYYLEGEERFHEVYGVFIGEEKAGQFYNYMRDNIFRGTEYQNYQKAVK